MKNIVISKMFGLDIRVSIFLAWGEIAGTGGRVGVNAHVHRFGWVKN